MTATIPTAESLLPLLCNYDPRNPDYADRVEFHEIHGMELPSAGRVACHCDNCHYGRHVLASALLTLIGERP